MTPCSHFLWFPPPRGSNVDLICSFTPFSMMWNTFKHTVEKAPPQLLLVNPIIKKGFGKSSLFFFCLVA